MPAQAFDTSKLGQGGSLFLSDIASVIGQDRKLKAQVDAAVKKLGKSPDDIMCGGVRFPGAWAELGGERVAPFDCEFGEQTLQIDGKVTLRSKRGEVFEKITRKAMKQASEIVYSKITWKWVKTEPDPPAPK